MAVLTIEVNIVVGYFHNVFQMSAVKNTWVYIQLRCVYLENINIFKLTC